MAAVDQATTTFSRLIPMGPFHNPYSNNNNNVIYSVVSRILYCNHIRLLRGDGGDDVSRNIIYRRLISLSAFRLKARRR